MAIILFMGAVSGAHLNPAVSLAFAARGDFPWRRVPGYVLLQLVGATLACLFLWAVLGKVGALGATEPGAGIQGWQAMLIELVLTAGLVSVILGTASSAQNVGALSAVAVGGYIILAGLWSSPISGASMNPARSLGPDLVNADFTNYWIYVVGPIAGAITAVGIAYILRGPGGDVGGIRAARGLDEEDARGPSERNYLAHPRVARRLDGVLATAYGRERLRTVAQGTSRTLAQRRLIVPERVAAWGHPITVAAGSARCGRGDRS